jgi:hypothetical protein
VTIEDDIGFFERVPASGLLFLVEAGAGSHQEFPDTESINAWYNSAEYQPLIALRNAATSDQDMLFVLEAAGPLSREACSRAGAANDKGNVEWGRTYDDALRQRQQRFSSAAPSNIFTHCPF